MKKEKKFYISFVGLDLEGYYTTNSGFVDFDYDVTLNDEYALTFDTREEAEDWCKHADKYGWDTFRTKFHVWSYDEPREPTYV